jgi:NADPH-dependent 2,4-dienoyl-CoA reductase/sulfur reductase-like enzyme/rhodanese-related sulfurtransferase
LRRLDESAEIVMVDRGPHVSFANCGLPYYVGGVIDDESKLLVANPALFRDRFRIEARTGVEAVAIDREAGEVLLRELATGAEQRERYDALVLSPGASPIRPPFPGIDLPGIFSLRNVPDAARIRAWVSERGARSAVIVGAGFIGLEMAENLLHLGLGVTVVEMAPQVMPPLDPEMAYPVGRFLEERGVNLLLGDAVAGFAPEGSGLVVSTQSGRRVAADLVILSIGVRPETGLAKGAGLELGPRGGIKVDAAMRTSDPRIWAVGDAVEVTDIVGGQPALVPLAGPANRQGRVAAASICGRDERFRGVQGTAICGVFDLAAAMTGASEKALVRAGATDFGVVYLHPGNHAGYYPGARPIHMKLIFRKGDGRILGAQAVGGEGVDKRIDVIAMALQMGGTVFDLEEAELCYAPQFGGAKDPVNFAGMIAANHLRGDLPLAAWASAGAEGRYLLDVRDPDEFAEGHVPGATNVPLASLRDRLAEVPRDRPVDVYCGVGQRAYYAVRLLRQRGVDAADLSGGYRTYGHLRGAGLLGIRAG